MVSALARLHSPALAILTVECLPQAFSSHGPLSPSIVASHGRNRTVIKISPANANDLHQRVLVAEKDNEVSDVRRPNTNPPSQNDRRRREDLLLTVGIFRELLPPIAVLPPACLER
jgi:hypothetical protein